jgi:type II secretory pathway pseudopilin PulG
MSRPTPQGGGERGAVLLVLMVGVAVMMILMGTAVQTWGTISQREREAEFIFRGQQYARAIQRFQKDNSALPTTMQQLYEPGPKGNSRYVRKKWKDPLTGADWVLLWLAPDGATLFRSDGRPSTSGTFRTAPGAPAGSNQATALNLNAQALTIPPGSPGYDAGKVKSTIDAYRRSTEQPVGASKAFGFNPDLNLAGFDTTSSLLTSPGIGPIVGVATSFTGQAFLEWKGRGDYAGYEISIFSFQDDRQGPQTDGLAPKRGGWAGRPR